MRGNNTGLPCIGREGDGGRCSAVVANGSVSGALGWVYVGGRRAISHARTDFLHLEWQLQLNQRGDEQEEKGRRGRCVLASNLGELVKCVLEYSSTSRDR